MNYLRSLIVQIFFLNKNRIVIIEGFCSKCRLMNAELKFRICNFQNKKKSQSKTVIKIAIQLLNEWMENKYLHQESDMAKKSDDLA
ncbi:hypothetical protein DERP_008232 [Dermatophagoides pteronyssinus]|uniref:Uncharacterized protein n=1 Tax=Dermatophagoides pteronyssinus TaxID=6956 RepID=A0ABQ8J5X8_DERPT|nr:hypothetical protein DERP_008232 [Dermatophagoides pteronyssinus]